MTPRTSLDFDPSDTQPIPRLIPGDPSLLEDKPNTPPISVEELEDLVRRADNGMTLVGADELEALKKRADQTPPVAIHLPPVMPSNPERSRRIRGRNLTKLAIAGAIAFGGFEVASQIPSVSGILHAIEHWGEGLWGHTPKPAKAVGEAVAHPVQLQESFSFTMRGAIERFKLGTTVGSLDAQATGHGDLDLQAVERILHLPKKIWRIPTSLSDHKDTPVNFSLEYDQQGNPIDDFHMPIPSSAVAGINVVQEVDATSEQDKWHFLVDLFPEAIPNPYLSGYIGPAPLKEGLFMQANDYFHGGNDLTDQQNITIMGLKRTIQVRGGQKLAPALQAAIANYFQQDLRMQATELRAIASNNPEAFGLTQESATKFANALESLSKQTVVIRVKHTVDNSETDIQKHQTISDPVTTYLPGSALATEYSQMLENEYRTPGSPLYFPDKATLASKSMLDVNPNQLHYDFTNSVVLGPVAQAQLAAATSDNNPYFYTGDLSRLKTPEQLIANSPLMRVE